MKDNGIGLDAHAIPSLFEMFPQLESAIDRAEGGLGIGLALVKGLVSLHGGRVEATSAGIGRGSQFTIYLPRTLVTADPAAAPAAPAAPAATGVAPAVIPPAPAAPSSGTGGAGSGGDSGTGGEIRTTQRRRVVIADDNHDAAEILGMLLEFEEYDVVLAGSGMEALTMGRLQTPDVVILDIGMPDMSGYDVARTLRSEAWGRHVFAIALTGWGHATDKQMAADAGFDHHFTKPCDAEEIIAVLKAHFVDRAD